MSCCLVFLDISTVYLTVYKCQAGNGNFGLDSFIPRKMGRMALISGVEWAFSVSFRVDGQRLVPILVIGQTFLSAGTQSTRTRNRLRFHVPYGIREHSCHACRDMVDVSMVDLSTFFSVSWFYLSARILQPGYAERRYRISGSRVNLPDISPR